MIQLILNDKEVSIRNPDRIAVTYQVNNIAELRDRQSDFSTEIDAPYTYANREIMESSDVLQSGSDTPYVRLSAKLLSNGIDLLKNGVAIVREASDAYKVRVFSGNYDFFDLIKDLSIRDLNLGKYNHIKTGGIEEASWSNTEGYIYPVIDYGQFYDPDIDLDSSFMLHSVFVKTIVERIAKEQGFEIIGDVLATDLYNKLILPHSVEGIQNEPYAEAQYFKVFKTPGNGQISSASQLIISFQKIEGDKLNKYVFGSIYGYSLSAGEPMIGTARISMLMQLPNPIPSGQTVRVIVTTPVTNQVVVEFDDSFAGQWVQIDRKAKVSIFPPLSGEFLQLGILNDTGEAVSIASGASLEWTSDAEFKLDQATVFSGGFPVDITGNLEDISQTDFMKFFGQLFAATFSFDGNKLIATTFNEIIDNKKIADDWSDKLDLSVTPVLSYIFGDYTQENKLTYDNDDSLQDDFGQGQFKINNRALKNSSDAIEFDFSASEDSIVRFTRSGTLYELGTIAIPRFTNAGDADLFDDTRSYEYREVVSFNALNWMWNSGLASSPGIKPPNGSWIIANEETESANPRIAILDYTEGGFPVARFIQSNKAVSLHGQDILDHHYPGLINAVDKSKVIDAYFYLTDNDIETLNFSIPKYVDYFGSYFYLNRIEKYQLGKSTKCKLVRI